MHNDTEAANSKGSTLAGLVRNETGIGEITDSQIRWLCLFVQSAYNVPKSKAVVYFEKNKKYVYLQPLDENNRPINRGDLHLSSALKGKDINKMQRGLNSYLNLKGYIIKIVRDLPSAVKRSRNVTELA